MNLRNELDSVLDEAAKAHLKYLISTAFLHPSNETAMKALQEELRRVESTYKQLEKLIEEL